MVSIPKEDITKLIDQNVLKRLTPDRINDLVDRVKAHDEKSTIDLISGYYPSSSIDFSLHTTHFIPPFRGFPKRFYSILEKDCFAYDYETSQKNPTSYRYENGEQVKGPFSEALNYWISVFLEKDKEIDVKTIDDLVQIVSLKDTDNNKNVSLNNLGFGVGQILPILYKCLSAKLGTLLIIDEPETHLHPSMQSKLADFFIQMALLGRKIIVETHSEYIIDKLIYHCIKTSKARDTTELYWVTNNKYNSSVTPIAYDDLGYVNNAPDGFLSEKTKLVEELTALRFAKLDNMGKGITQ